MHWLQTEGPREPGAALKDTQSEQGSKSHKREENIMGIIKSIIEADKVHDVVKNLPDFIHKAYENYFADVPRGDEVMSILEFTECLYPNALRDAMKEAGL